MSCFCLCPVEVHWKSIGSLMDTEFWPVQPFLLLSDWSRLSLDFHQTSPGPAAEFSHFQWIPMDSDETLTKLWWTVCWICWKWQGPMKVHRKSSGSVKYWDISSSDPNSLDSDTSDDTYKYYKQRNNKKSKKYHRHKGKKHTKKCLSKHIPPDKYDGVLETQLFHKFMAQLMAYLEDSNVPKHCHVYILSNFLTDKAYTFYTHDVSHDPKCWTTAKFFKALFDDVFPVNFHL